MIEWRRLYAKPAGSLPGGIVTQWGAGIITIFVLVFLTYWIGFGGEGRSEAELALAAETDQEPGGSFTDRMAAQIKAEALRAETRRAAADRALRARQQQQTNNAGPGPAGAGADEAMLLAGPSPETGQPYTEEEWELRERLRLEAIERRSRSLRSSPVAQTYRQLDGAAPAGAGARQEQKLGPASPAEAMRAEEAALEEALGTIAAVTAGLEDEVAAEAEADRTFIEALKGTPTAHCGHTPRPPFLQPQQGPHRGRTLPCPALLLLKIPRVGSASMKARFLKRSWSRSSPATSRARSWPWSPSRFTQADRQRVLVPRGARIIGTARAVANQDQSRLAVSFHRLILPDGRSVSLEFHGLNQLGEGALKDQVDRHYFSMFAAVGAVGVLSGLTAARGNPYEGGVEGFQAGAGQGLGQAATRILDRFLNRLPTLTIRAGHRLRIWFTSDVLVPRPLKKGD